MSSLTEQLRKLEKQIDLHEFEGRKPTTSLGEDPAQGFAVITEYKAAIDRMRYITWIYMEAAANSAEIPVQAVPQALRQKNEGKSH